MDEWWWLYTLNNDSPSWEPPPLWLIRLLTVGLVVFYMWLIFG